MRGQRLDTCYSRPDSLVPSTIKADETGEECTHSNGHPRRWPSLTLRGRRLSVYTARAGLPARLTGLTARFTGLRFVDV